ncbi:MAG: transporter substrate-binding domain-containing protein [Acetobacteraceae bacterium]|nr:transporter substrate-binding domain-containing protein [Acetobacteraceae bacterium]
MRLVGTGWWRGLALAMLLAGPAWGQAGPRLAAARTRDLAIGTKEAPPFAMKGPDGHWHGLSVTLWERVAQRLGLHFHWVEAPMATLLADTASGKLDGAIAAVSVTAAREKTIDFTQPYYSTGLGIATVRRGNAGAWALVRAVFSMAFAQAVFGLIALLLAVGVAIWLLERRRNDQFGGGWLRGLGNGFWWSAVTMTTVGYGDKSPSTAAGRFVAIVWMFASVILISGVTAGITTALTTAEINGAIHGPQDLGSVRVGSIDGSASAAYLEGQQIVWTGLPSVHDGLEAVASGQIDAFVYDRPLLQYEVRHMFQDQVEVLPATFDRQSYAMVLPQGSPLREPIDQTLLSVIQSREWSDEVFKAVGNR